MSDLVVMPKADWQAILDSTRSKAGTEDLIKSGGLSAIIDGIVSGGVDTSDATATAAAILNGLTAYVNGEKITGSIPSKAAATYSPSNVNIKIPAGQYLAGDQTISGDNNFISSNIKKGVSLWGKTGTYEGELPAGITAIETGSITPSSKTNALDIAHSLGVAPNFYIIYSASSITNAFTNTSFFSAGVKQGLTVQNSTYNAFWTSMHWTNTTTIGQTYGGHNNSFPISTTTTFRATASGSYGFAGGKTFNWICGVASGLNP